jgi:hypothetical protein
VPSAGRITLYGVATRRAAPRRVARFRPFKAPTSPPPGYSDPALDAQLRATQRGYQDLQGDVQLNAGRSLDDYSLGVQQQQQGLARSMADLNTRLQRENLGYTTSTQGLQRDYTNLASSQDQQQRQALGGASGASAGGAALASAIKRQGNQAISQTALDTAHSQQLQDITTAQQRAQQDEQSQLGQLGVQYGRGTQDAQTQLSRAGRETGFAGLDTTAEKFFSAAGAGYIPPSAPANEYTRRGVTYRKVGGQRFLPSGRRVSLAGLRSLYR